MGENLIGDATEAEAGEAAPPVGSHHDQVTAALDRLAHNRRTDIAAGHYRVRWNARGQGVSRLVQVAACPARIRGGEFLANQRR